MKQSLIIIILFLYNFVVLFWTRKVLMRSWIDNWNWMNLKFTYNCCVITSKILKRKGSNLSILHFK